MSNLVFSGCFPNTRQCWIIIYFPSTPVHGQTVTCLSGITSRMHYIILSSRCDTETSVPYALVYALWYTDKTNQPNHCILNIHSSHAWMGRLLSTCYFRRFGAKKYTRKTSCDLQNSDSLQSVSILPNI